MQLGTEFLLTLLSHSLLASSLSISLDYHQHHHDHCLYFHHHHRLHLRRPHQLLPNSSSSPPHPHPPLLLSVPCAHPRVSRACHKYPSSLLYSSLRLQVLALGATESGTRLHNVLGVWAPFFAPALVSLGSWHNSAQPMSFG